MNWTVGNINTELATAKHLEHIAPVMYRACTDDQGVYNLAAFDVKRVKYMTVCPGLQLRSCPLNLGLFIK